MVRIKYYSCPSCKTHNEEYVTYCKRCGAWMAEAFLVQPRKSKLLPALIWGVIIFAGMIGIIMQLSPNIKVGIQQEVQFDDMQFGDKYTISQLEVNGGKVVADLITHIDIDAPLNIQLVFYDSNDQRIGIASGSVRHKLPAGARTTVVFTTDNDLREIRSVHAEIIPESPIETLQRLGDMINK